MRPYIEDCTFRPIIGRKPRPSQMAAQMSAQGSARDSVASAPDRNSVPFPERLYNDADNRYRARESAKRQLAEAEVASYPFQPAINDNSRAAVEAGLHR